MRVPVLIGAVTLALVGAGTARADHLAPIPPSTASPVVNNVGGGGTYRVTGAAQAAVAVKGYDPVAAPWSPAGTNSIPAKINRMQRAGRILPKLRVLGNIGALASLIPIVWKISEAGNDYYYEITTDRAGYNATITTEDPGWYYCVTDTACSHTGLHTDHPTLPYSDYWLLAPDKDTPSSAIYYTGPGGFGVAWWNAMAPGIASTADAAGDVDLHVMAHSANPTIATQAGNAFEDSEVTRATSGDFAAAPANRQKTTNYTTPGDVGTDADKDAMGAVLVNPDGSQTDAQKATEEAIAADLYPGQIEDPYEMTLLQPEPNETYTDYVTRLQAAGWLGTATTTVLTTELAGYGPEAVARVVVQGSPNAVYDPLAWPSAGVQISQTTDITVRYNPSTAAPAPTTGGGTTTVTGTPTTIPSPPAIDFGPLTDIDFGCKFPYGFLTCYAIGFTELFEVTEDAPVFSFDLGVDIPLCNDCEAAYVVDLNVMDDYMTLWRTILSVCLWVGAVYFVATRFLGFKAGGDPGEAIEDVL